MCKIKCLNIPYDSLESLQVSSPWSESMTRLMMKLDQLNLDIEEALSESSSPCGTPGTMCKKQVSALTGSVTHGYPLYCCVYHKAACRSAATVCTVHIPVKHMLHTWSCFRRFPEINLLCSGDRETQRIIWTDALDSNELWSPASHNSVTGLYDLPLRLYGQHLTRMSLFYGVCVWYFWCHTAVHGSAGSRNRPLLSFWGCDEDHAAPFLKRAPLTAACFMKYPTRVSTKEQKCSFGFRMYVWHRGAIVCKEICMIWSIRNGAERLPCLPGICITISGIHCYLL